MEDKPPLPSPALPPTETYWLSCLSLDLCLYLEERQRNRGVYQQRPRRDTKGYRALNSGRYIILNCSVLSILLPCFMFQVIDLRGNSIPVLEDNIFSTVSSELFFWSKKFSIFLQSIKFNPPFSFTKIIPSANCIINLLFSWESRTYRRFLFNIAK